MALIKSISGIRGTIGGIPGENLTPVDIVKFTAAYGTWIKQRNPGKYPLSQGIRARLIMKDACGSFLKWLDWIQIQSEGILAPQSFSMYPFPPSKRISDSFIQRVPEIPCCMETIP